MRLAWLLALALAAPACVASTAQIERAKASSYQTDRATVFRAMKDSVEANYQLSYWNEQAGVVESQWKEVKGDLEEQQARSSQGDRITRGAKYFRLRLVLSTNGPPWSVLVDGIAGEFRPGLALIYQFKHGVEDEPPWVQGRIDTATVDVYESLKPYAVAGGPSTAAPAPRDPASAPPPPPPGPAPAPAPAPPPPAPASMN